MTNKMSDYNKMAPYYNRFTNVISEGGNIRSQRYFLDFIQFSDNILNVGCGSVQFNIDLAKKYKFITSVDISSRMIEIAKKGLNENGIKQSNFICSDILKFKPSCKYDVVFANFVLNTFNWETCCGVIRHIDTLIKAGGLLCIADENVVKKGAGKITQMLFRPLISFIHHLWANHPLHAIYNYDNELLKLGYIVVEKKVDSCGFIVSTIYKKFQKEGQ